mmetsp:Transcript_3767/g.9604  ORF Transcript_3767/g.9604 Transcript_3767/m.9604 type:complete len:682 (-) Transcript_3767:160-2205(-)
MGRQLLAPADHRSMQAPMGKSAAAGGEFPWLEGDWRCPECGTLNFGSSSQCFRCMKPSPMKVKKEERASPPKVAPTLQVKDEGSSSSSTAPGFKAAGVVPRALASQLDAETLAMGSTTATATAEPRGKPCSAADLSDQNLTVDRIKSYLRNPLRQVEELVRGGAIQEIWRRSAGGVGADVLSATLGARYTVLVQPVDAVGVLQAQCTCPDFSNRGGLCKHGAAVLLAMVPGNQLRPAFKQELVAKEEATEALAAPAPQLSQVKCEMRENPLAEVKSETRENRRPTEELFRAAEKREAAEVLGYGEDTWQEQEAADQPPGPSMMLVDGPTAEPGLSTAMVAPPPAKRRRLPESFTAPPAVPSATGRARGSKESAPRSDRALDVPKSRASRGKGPDGMVKKPRTAYQFFLQETRATPGANNWKQLAEEERRPYEAAAFEDRARYDAELKAAQDAVVLADDDVEMGTARDRLNAASGMEERMLKGNPFAFNNSPGSTSRAQESKCAFDAALSPSPLRGQNLPAGAAAQLLQPCMDMHEVAQLGAASASATGSAGLQQCPARPALTGMEFFDDSDVEDQPRPVTAPVGSTLLAPIATDGRHSTTHCTGVDVLAAAQPSAAAEERSPPREALRSFPPQAAPIAHELPTSFSEMNFESRLDAAGADKDVPHRAPGKVSFFDRLKELD